jgi:hypothetical protein
LKGLATFFVRFKISSQTLPPHSGFGEARSTQFRPFNTADSGGTGRQRKSPFLPSQSSVPEVTPINSVSVLLLASQYSTSLPTQGEAADYGEDSSARSRLLKS